MKKRNVIINKTKPRISVFGGSFNPPGLHHREIVQKLRQEFDRVLVVPCGFRSDKQSATLVSSEQRKQMIEYTFADMPGVEVLYFDLEAREYTRTFDLDERLQVKYDAELWHAIGTDIIQGGAGSRSEIHESWYRGSELWTKLNFVIINRQDVPASPADFPLKSCSIKFDNNCSSTEIRKRIGAGESIEKLVVPEVASFIATEGIYLTQQLRSEETLGQGGELYV